MKIKTSELIDGPLDWAVEVALGTHWSANGYFVYAEDDPDFKYRFTKETRRYSTNPAQAWPIIERERIIFDYYDSHPCDPNDVVHAKLSRARLKPDGRACWYAPQRGATALIAAMRCFVASKLGDEVDVPEELCQ